MYSKLRFCFPTTALMAMTFALAGLPANADPVHAWSAPYSVEIQPTSTIYTNVVGFNGAETRIGDYAFQPPENPAEGFRYGSGPVGIFDATFTADAGYVFTSVDLGLGEYSWYNDAGNGLQGFQIDWSIPGSTYSGLSFLDPSASYTWVSVTGGGGGTSGTLHYYNPYPGSGGTASGAYGHFLPPGATLALANVTSFTIHLTEQSWGAGNQTHIVSKLRVNAATEYAPPTPVPEPETYAMLLAGLGLLSFTAKRRKRSA
jgi:hypothetical protein